MKTVKQMMVALVALAVSVPAVASVNLEGSHRGKWSVPGGGEKVVELLVQKVPQREGSYFGLMIRGDDRAVLYLMDEADTDTTFAMIPAQVTEDGEIGWRDDNPSLILQVGEIKSGGPVMTVTNSNSGNTEGFQGVVRFDGSSSTSYKWLSAMSGRFVYNSREYLDIGQFSDGEGSVTSTLRSMSGTFKVREKRAQMFTLRAVAYKNTGSDVQVNPRKIMLYIEKKGMLFGRTQKVLLVNPENEADIIVLNRQ